MFFKFKKEVSYAYACEVEADSLEEAVTMVNNEGEWELDEDAEGYICGHCVEKYNDDEDCYEEVDCDWNPLS